MFDVADEWDCEVVGDSKTAIATTIWIEQRTRERTEAPLYHVRKPSGLQGHATKIEEDGGRYALKRASMHVHR